MTPFYIIACALSGAQVSESSLDTRDEADRELVRLSKVRGDEGIYTPLRVEEYFVEEVFPDRGENNLDQWESDGWRDAA